MKNRKQKHKSYNSMISTLKRRRMEENFRYWLGIFGILERWPKL